MAAKADYVDINIETDLDGVKVPCVIRYVFDDTQAAVADTIEAVKDAARIKLAVDLIMKEDL